MPNTSTTTRTWWPVWLPVARDPWRLADEEGRYFRGRDLGAKKVTRAFKFKTPGEAIAFAKRHELTLWI